MRAYVEEFQSIQTQYIEECELYVEEECQRTLFPYSTIKELDNHIRHSSAHTFQPNSLIEECTIIYMYMYSVCVCVCVCVCGWPILLS